MATVTKPSAIEGQENAEQRSAEQEQPLGFELRMDGKRLPAHSCSIVIRHPKKGDLEFVFENGKTTFSAQRTSIDGTVEPPRELTFSLLEML